MKFYDFFRSSAAYRVRIALNIKGLTPERVVVSLPQGDMKSDWYSAVNPQQLVPAIEVDGVTVMQSMAILEYLEEVYPDPPLLPADPLSRGRVRAMAQMIACEIHPLNNLRVINYLADPLGVDAGQRQTWYAHWLGKGFAALEELLSRDGGAGAYCHGDQVTLADVLLVPQVFNARRFEVDLTPYPTITRIDAALTALQPFADAAPARQPDAF